MIPIEKWGSDHWSTFAYVETRVVDYDGYLDLRHLRGFNGPDWEEKYPTRLKAGEEVYGHSDLDCIKDMVEAGLLIGGRATQRDSKGDIKALTYRYELTPKGQVVAGKLRAFKGHGGKYANFDPGATLGWWAASATNRT